MEGKASARPFPLVTLVFVALAGLLYMLAPQGTVWLNLVYSRTALAQGEWWRLLTGHLLHFSWSHLAADIGSFLLLGVLLERAQGRLRLMVLLLVLAAGISAALWCLVPELAYYGGSSALNYGLLTWLCLTQRTGVHARWPWIALLFPVVMIAHIGWQAATEASLLVAGLPGAVRVAWQAHLAAVLLASGCAGAALTASKKRAVCGAAP